jgi:hypothetical protein
MSASLNPVNIVFDAAGNLFVGNNTQGRVTVVFRGNWVTDIARTNLQALELVEIA